MKLLHFQPKSEIKASRGDILTYHLSTLLCSLGFTTGLLLHNLCFCFRGIVVLQTYIICWIKVQELSVDCYTSKVSTQVILGQKRRGLQNTGHSLGSSC